MPSRRSSLAFAMLACGVSLNGYAQQPTGQAVEFFNTVLGHYFMTADPAEATGIDQGAAGPGWQRTSGVFGIYRNATDAAGLAPVCRFYGTPGVGPNSHFYTADPAECAQVKTDPGWTYEGIAFYIVPVSSGTCPAGTTAVYRSYNNGYVRDDSNHRFTVDATVFAKSSSFGYSPEGVVMCAPLSTADVQEDAVRLLRQGTFGPTETDEQHAAAIGAAAWVDEQLAMPLSAYPSYPWVETNRPATCVDDKTLPVRSDSYCARDNYSLFPMQVQFFRNAVTQPDQLRARVAFALSQVLVTSGLSNARNYAMREYQEVLVEHAFGNYYDLLTAVTLSPNMGDYLDMANNNKADPVAGTQPNENYGREILQLFSVGTWLLNADGTWHLDDFGRPIPTYSQGIIEGYAQVFTGWTYPAAPGATSKPNNPKSYLGSMVSVDAKHDFSAKTLLAGATAAAGLSMADDLAFAHRSIFQHPNVGPFISRQLIQKLVTSDPTPAYVARVAAVFANDGTGQRGNLRAVVRAILLDAEARGALKIDPGYGKLMEPALFAAATVRSLSGKSDGVFLRSQSASLSQDVFNAPSVFNFYSPSYVIPETTLVGPEFGLLTSATAIGRANFANTLVLGGDVAPDPSVFGATGTQLDVSAYAAVAANASALADRIEAKLLAGNMSTVLRQGIVSAVNAVAASDTTGRARTALYLTLSSPEYQVQR